MIMTNTLSPTLFFSFFIFCRKEVSHLYYLKNLQITGCAISRKTVVSVGNGMLGNSKKWWQNKPISQMVKKYSHIKWVKRRGTTAKGAINPAL